MAKDTPTRKDRYQAIFDAFDIPKGDGRRDRIKEKLGKNATAKDLFQFLKKKTGLNKDQTYLDFADAHPKKFPGTALKETSQKEALNAIYTSPEFTGLSPVQQQLVIDAIKNFTPDQLNNTGLSDGEKEAIATEAWNRATEVYNVTVDELNQDREQALRQDTVILQKTLDQQQAIYDNAIANNDMATAEATKISLTQLGQALAKATEEYGIAANRKNEDLATKLADVQKELNTTNTRTNEDKVMQLRQAERQYRSQLTAVQDNMSQRGFAYSTPRIKAEEEVTQNYNDTVTTAQLIAKRTQEDAQLKAQQEARDARLMTTRDTADLLRYYTGQERGAVQSAETALGTAGVQSAIAGQSGINGTLGSNVVGGLSGSINTNSAQNALSAQLGYTSGVQGQASNYESAYGSDQANSVIGSNPLYSTIGGLTGSTNTAVERGTKTAEQQRNVDTEAIKQTEEQALYLSKI